jgi:hypothetical protein
MWTIIIFSLFIAIIITAIFTLFFKNTGPWGGFWIFFVIVFLVAMIAGEWTTPVGPHLYGFYWVPAVFLALVVAFIIAAATPTPGGMRPVRRRPFEKPGSSKATRYDEAAATDPEPEADTEPETTTSVAIGALVWVVLFLLFIAAIGGLLY